MNASEKLYKFVESWEGCNLVVYLDQGGKPTIGVGHLLKPGDTFKRIDEDTALHLLAQDMQEAEDAINDLVTAPLEQHQFDALCAFAFNIGTGEKGFKGSHALMWLNQKDYGACADAFLAWNHVNGAVSKGLTRRRNAEKTLFTTGEYVENV